ncbi:EpsG family protein [Vibrio harveyi]
MCVTLLSAFRFQVGSDFDSYWKMFDIISNDIPHLWQNKEIGYLTLIRIVSNLGGNQQVIVILFSFSTTILSYLGLRDFFKDFQQSNLLHLAILVIFLFQIYFPSLNQIRQYFVLSLFIYALRFYFSERYLTYVTLMLLSTTIHFTGIIVLFASLFINVNLLKRKYIYIFVVIVLSLNPAKYIVDAYISHSLPYYQYFTIKGLIGESSKLSVISSYIMLCVFLLTLVIGTYDVKSKKHIALINLSFIFIVVKVIGADFEIINRVSNYFKVFFYLHVLNFTFNLKFKSSKHRQVLAFMSILLIVISGLLSVVLRAKNDEAYNNVDFNLCTLSSPCSLSY